MLINMVLNTIKENELLDKGDGVVVGVSGGPDSVCLLHVLHTLSGQLGIGIYAVHINHMLRGSESDEDQKYVERLCSLLDIPLHVQAFDIEGLSRETGTSLEEAGRNARYKEFKKVCDRVGAKKIAVAHNRNDQAETILMHIIRGAGLEGLKGMDYKRDEVVRPLLDVDRQDIEEYCRYNSLSPRIDSSNLKNIYTRNKIRIDLIPYISSLFNTDITGGLIKMSALVKDDNSFIEGAAFDSYNESVISKSSNEIQLDIIKLKNNHPAIQKRILRNSIKDIKGDLKGIENIHVEKAIGLALKGQTGKYLHLPSQIYVEKSYNILKVFANQRDSCPGINEKKINIPGITMIDDFDIVISAEIISPEDNFKRFNALQNKSNIQFFDYEKVKSGINIRNRKEGDVFKPYKSTGTKKLKEYFIDNKISRELRETIPVVASGSEIVWIIGHKISDKFKVTENTKSILKLEYKEGNRQ